MDQKEEISSPGPVFFITNYFQALILLTPEQIQELQSNLDTRDKEVAEQARERAMKMQRSWNLKHPNEDKKYTDSIITKPGGGQAVFYAGDKKNADEEARRRLGKRMLGEE